MKILVISLVFAFLMTTAIIQMASGANDLNVSINKVATPIVGTCNNFQVELNITGKAPSKPVDVVIVIDISGSMGEGSSPTSLDYAKSAAKSFSYNILHTNPQSRVGLVSYSDTATKVLDFTSTPSTVNTSINGLTASGYTNIDAGIYTAYHGFTFRAGCKYGSTIVLLTDGVANRDRSGDSCVTWPTTTTLCTSAAINSGIAAQKVALIYCIGLLGDVHTNYPTSENIARNTLIAMQNGGYYQTYQGADLSGIYASISSKLNIAAVNALVIDTVANTFNIISGTVNLIPSNRGTAGTVGNVITWTIPTLTSETLKLKYNVTAKSGTCGTQSVNSLANVSYTTAGCLKNTLTFPNPMVDCTCITVSLSPLSGELNCNVASKLLTATVTNGKAPFTYVWYNGSTIITGATTSTYTATTPGSYKVVVNDANLCSGTSAVSTITQVRNPTVSISPTSGELGWVSSILLTATAYGGKGTLTYQWYNGPVIISGATESTYTATIAGNYSVTVTDENGCTGIAMATITKPSIAVTKSVNLTQGAPSTKLNFTINVTNTDHVTLSPVKVVDTLPFGLNYVSSNGTDAGNVVTWTNIGPLSPGRSRYLYLVAHINGSAYGALTNKVNVTGTSPTTGLNYFANDSKVVTALRASLLIQKTYNLTEAYPHQIVNITINATNTGEVTLNPVTMLDKLPSLALDTAYVSSNGTYNGSWVTWNNIGPLAPNEKKQMFLIARITGFVLGNVTNTVFGIGTPPTGDKVYNQSTAILKVLTRNIDMSLVKNAIPSKAAYGEIVTFYIMLKNTGNETFYLDKGVDVLPTGLTYVSDNWTGPKTISGKTITANFGGIAYPPGRSACVMINASVDGDQFGFLTNNIEGFYHTLDGLNLNNSRSAVVEALYNPGISITKNATPTTAGPGDNVTFIINATNTGNIPLPTVRVVDVLPVSMVYVSDNRNGTASGNLITWSNVGPLAVRQSTYIRLNATVSL